MRMEYIQEQYTVKDTASTTCAKSVGLSLSVQKFIVSVKRVKVTHNKIIIRSRTCITQIGTRIKKVLSQPFQNRYISANLFLIKWSSMLLHIVKPKHKKKGFRILSLTFLIASFYSLCCSLKFGMHACHSL